MSVVKNSKPMPYRCRLCRKYFSVRTGTILAESKLPILKWLMAAYLIASSRKRMSSVLLGHHLDVRQATAWFLVHRIRASLGTHGGLLGSEVEVDETFIGGKARNKYVGKRDAMKRGPVDKHAVMGMQERSGKVRSLPITGTSGMVLKSHVIENIK